jgi:hypothetical protein
VDRAIAKNHIQESCCLGWLNLVDNVFDNQPENVQTTEVFPKWAGLEVRFRGEDEHFMEITRQVYSTSRKMCEICGKSRFCTVMDGWETTLCEEHLMLSDAKAKSLGEK